MDEGGAICSFSANQIMEAWHNFPFYKPFLYKKPFHCLLWYKTCRRPPHPLVYNLIYFLTEKGDSMVPVFRELK